MKALSNLLSRSALASALGQTFGGKRDMYETLGYKKSLTTEDFWAMYQRGGIAKRIVNAYPQATWKDEPTVREDDDNAERNTQFEQAWDGLVERLNVYRYLERADTLCQLGQYSILILGVKGNANLESPAPAQQGPDGLLYLTPISQQRASVHRFVENTTDPRYGLPELYKVEFTHGTGKSTTTRTKLVHWTRVLHIAEGTLENDVLGTPRLEAVFNNLEDLLKVSGGSAEMFWLNAAQRLVANVDPNAQMTDEDKEALNEELEEYMHQLRRFIRTQGVDIQTLNGQVFDPGNHVDVLLDLISGTEGIPKRILTGSERGELASSSDDSNWSNRVGERRINHVTPNIIKPFVRRLLDLRILPAPNTDNFIVDWPQADALGDKDRAEVANKVSGALSQYMQSGGELIVPRTEFRETYLGLEAEPEGGFEEPEEDELEDEEGNITQQQPGNKDGEEEA